MIAGLSFQVFTLFSFMTISLDFALRTRRRIRSLGADAALAQDIELQKIRRSFMFQGFLVAIATATVSIFVRSIFRVVELSKGWTGPIMGNQPLFIGFEGVCIAVAVLVLNVFHPAICFGHMFEGKGGIGAREWLRWKRGKEDVVEGEKAGNGSGSEGSSSKGAMV